MTILIFFFSDDHEQFPIFKVCDLKEIKILLKKIYILFDLIYKFLKFEIVIDVFHNLIILMLLGNGKQNWFCLIYVLPILINPLRILRLGFLSVF